MCFSPVIFGGTGTYQVKRMWKGTQGKPSTTNLEILSSTRADAKMMNIKSGPGTAKLRRKKQQLGNRARYEKLSVSPEFSAFFVYSADATRWCAKCAEQPSSASPFPKPAWQLRMACFFWHFPRDVFFFSDKIQRVQKCVSGTKHVKKNMIQKNVRTAFAANSDEGTVGVSNKNTL